MQGRTGMQNFWAGAGKAVADTGFGLKQLGAAAGNAVGLVEDETINELNRMAQYRRERDAPLMDTGAGLAGNIAGNVATMAAGGLGLRAGAAGAAKLGAAGTASRLGTAGQALINPQTVKQAAAAGAALGAVTPATSMTERAQQTAVGAGVGAAAQKAGQALTALGKGGSEAVRPEVKQLAERAKQLGIKIRADQIVRNKPLGAIAQGNEYIPFSGMGAAKEAQQKQFNVALSKTLGEVTDNPAEALKRAGIRLNKEYETTLQNNVLNIDNQFMDDMSRIVQEANSELVGDQLSAITKQVDNILQKGAAGNGAIDGQAAYNIKKMLDRLGSGADSSKAHYATEMRKALMSALDRSLGPEKAAKFATTRRQYANMLELDRIIPAGAEADVSAVRLAGRRDIGTKDLRELQDIAATFLKPQEGNPGTAPTLFGAGIAGGGIPAAIIDPTTTAIVAAGGLTGGRATTAALNSEFLREYAVNGMSPKARALLDAVRKAQIAAPATAAALQNQ